MTIKKASWDEVIYQNPNAKCAKCNDNDKLIQVDRVKKIKGIRCLEIIYFCPKCAKEEGIQFKGEFSEVER